MTFSEPNWEQSLDIWDFFLNSLWDKLNRMIVLAFKKQSRHQHFQRMFSNLDIWVFSDVDGCMSENKIQNMLNAHYASENSQSAPNIILEIITPDYAFAQAGEVGVEKTVLTNTECKTNNDKMHWNLRRGWISKASPLAPAQHCFTRSRFGCSSHACRYESQFTSKSCLPFFFDF